MIDKMCYRIVLMFFTALLIGCNNTVERPLAVEEDVYSNTDFQGIWYDSETENIVLRVKGDTIYYPDSINSPAKFKILNDTLYVGNLSIKCKILKSSPNVFWFENGNGEIVKLSKSSNLEDSVLFKPVKAEVGLRKTVLKKDTVLSYDGKRYHCYIAVNPTKFKVVINTLNPDGVDVEQIYYDNIIHLSIYQGNSRIFSKDIKKSMFDSLIPRNVFPQTVLDDMDFDKIDADGFHFNTVVCIPGGASCYMLHTNVSMEGEMKMELVEF